jgi:membrane-associated phospholipid phosphatase
VELPGFDHSFPSGHSLRAVLIAAMAVSLWPRLRPAGVAWVMTVALLLQLGGIHTVTDTLGGLLLGAVFLLLFKVASAPGPCRSRPLMCTLRPRRPNAQL